MSNNQELIDGLRGLADFIEKNDLPHINDDMRMFVMYQDAEGMAAFARAAGRTKKCADNDTYDLIHDVNRKVRITAFTLRENVCTRREVGTRVVPEVPAQPARVEPVYEWDCSESILAKADAGAVTA